ncbi:glycosyltransferase, partial [candidate division KSB1 bacterium]|nr:glycosyltransferase [Phycisphaerae bacterium]NIP55819.1 glycosyltransferase [Phycisphaerae bacterium]NIV91214.1 glycosyltransferase [candidate division KSB1 bacterium]NIX27959.1 glycosyltransferase [Phycisphaerae bacterium]
MTNPLVTIGIPTYNRADANLATVIDAALGQTYDNIEVLIADNASTDATSEIIESIDDSRLTYVR